MNLASPKQPWDWGTAQDTVFAKLHDLLCNPPVLKLPDFGKPFVTDTDACKNATGAVLLQQYDDGLHSIAYHSSKYTPVERNYGVDEKELLTIFQVCVKWLYHIDGILTTYMLTTNHGSLLLHNRTLVDVRCIGLSG